jgi:hypothetical protein
MGKRSKRLLVTAKRLPAFKGAKPHAIWARCGFNELKVPILN